MTPLRAFHFWLAGDNVAHCPRPTTEATEIDKPAASMRPHVCARGQQGHDDLEHTLYSYFPLTIETSCLHSPFCPAITNNIAF